MQTTSAIIIPIGRRGSGGCCVVLPCGCTMGLFGVIGGGLLLAFWRRVARR